MVLLRGPRLASALVEVNEAIEHAETIAARLNSSLDLLRSRRDELAAKMVRDTELALTHQCADPQTAVVVSPAPPRRVWSYF